MEIQFRFEINPGKRAQFAWLVCLVALGRQSRQNLTRGLISGVLRSGFTIIGQNNNEKELLGFPAQMALYHFPTGIGAVRLAGKRYR